MVKMKKLKIEVDLVGVSTIWKSEICIRGRMNEVCIVFMMHFIELRARCF